MVDLVAENIYKITVPIPFPLREVNVYVLIGRDGWALFDAAIGTEEARRGVFEGLSELGLRLEDLRAIVLSHAHPDHIGLSGELQVQSAAPVYMHAIDELVLQLYWKSPRTRNYAQAQQFFKPHGMPLESATQPPIPADKMRQIINVPPHESFVLVEDGQEIELLSERYQVLWVPGHSDGLISLYRTRDGVYLASDHILPRISPNVGIYSQYSRPNPLGDYLNSLRKVQYLPARIVLPGHGSPLADLHGRVRELIEHHREREGQILDLLAQHPQHAYQLARQLFGQRLKNQDAWRMATAETLSHLEHLRLGGQVKQHSTSDGLIIYMAV